MLVSCVGLQSKKRWECISRKELSPTVKETWSGDNRELGHVFDVV